VEKRKKDRQKVVAKKRNLESLAKDAKRRTEDFERRVGGLLEKWRKCLIFTVVSLMIN